jgi:hypothetical protein
MDQAVRQLNRGEAQPARETQRRAAEQLDRAAQQAEDLLAALRAESARAPDAPDPGAAADRIADAQDAQTLAAQQLPHAAAEAAQAMRRAADDLRAAAQPRDANQAEAQALAQADPAATPPDESPNPDPESTMGGRDDPDLAILRAQLQAQTGRAWGELPGHLRSELLRQARGRYRDDYARLIRLYFREIASESSPR